MAGTNSGFNAAEFRTAIRFVYEMAAPVKTDEQVYFYKNATSTYDKGVDSDDVPFDPSATATVAQDPPIQVPCGIELQDSSGATIEFGTVDAARLVLTLLDQDYQKVKNSDYVMLRGEKYNYKRTVPPTSLFNVGLYDMHFEAESMT